MAVEVLQISMSPKKSRARRSYWRPDDVIEILKIVVVKSQSLGGVYVPKRKSHESYKGIKLSMKASAAYPHKVNHSYLQRHG